MGDPDTLFPVRHDVTHPQHPLFAIAYASAACGEAEHFRPTQVSGLDSLKLSAKRTPSKLIVLPWSELSHIRPPPSSYHSWFLLADLQDTVLVEL